jgi:sRNA-binding regulator protein Hfq
MPTFRLEPWEEGTYIELCDVWFCFELRDREHRVHVFLNKDEGKGGATLDIRLQKIDGYREHIKNMLYYEVYAMLLKDHPRFREVYEHAIGLFREHREVNLHLKWQDDGIEATMNIIMDRESVDVQMKLAYGPHQIYYSTDKDTENHEDALKELLENAAGLHELFKKYIRSDQLQQKA